MSVTFWVAPGARVPVLMLPVRVCEPPGVVTTAETVAGLVAKSRAWVPWLLTVTVTVSALP